MFDWLYPTRFWLEQLPQHLRPDDDKIEEMEKLRRHAVCFLFGLPNDSFAAIILSSPWATRKVQEHTYKMAKEQMPNASEKEILEALFRSRLYPQNPAGLHIAEHEVEHILRDIDTLDDLIRYFLEKEKEEPRFFKEKEKPWFFRDILGAGKKVAYKVDKILER